VLDQAEPWVDLHAGEDGESLPVIIAVKPGGAEPAGAQVHKVVGVAPVLGRHRKVLLKAAVLLLGRFLFPDGTCTFSSGSEACAFLSGSKAQNSWFRSLDTKRKPNKRSRSGTCSARPCNGILPPWTCFHSRVVVSQPDPLSPHMLSAAAGRFGEERRRVYLR
jgi:hypothetical protein